AHNSPKCKRRGSDPAPSKLTILCVGSARSAAETSAATAAETTRPGAARTTGTTAARTTGCAERRLRLARDQAFTLRALSGELARPADRLRLLARLLLGGFFVVAAELHLAENALALHLLFERLEGLIDIVVADENLQTNVPSLLVVNTGLELSSGS